MRKFFFFNYINQSQIIILLLARTNNSLTIIGNRLKFTAHLYDCTISNPTADSYVTLQKLFTKLSIHFHTQSLSIRV